MTRAAQIISLVCAVLPLTRAKSLVWQHDDGSSTWAPAQETLAEANLGMDLMPAPTEAPSPGELRKRQRGANTCAFVSGNPLDTLTCYGTLTCVYNDILQVVGCCDLPDARSCTIATTCFDRTASARLGTSITSGTYYCGDINYPQCVAYAYTGNTWNGYTIFGCGRTRATILVNVNAGTSSFSPSSISLSSSSTASTRTNTRTSTPDPGPGPKKTGAIIGGAVGGVAAVTILAVGGFFLIRRRRNADSPDSPTTISAAPLSPGAAPSMYVAQHMPPMTQTPPAGYPPPGGGYPPPGPYPQQGFAPVEQGQMQAYNYQPYQNSPSASPPPLGTGYVPPSYLPPDEYQQQQNAPVQYQGQYQSQPYTMAPGRGQQPVEMPAVRGDGELRELS